MKYSSWARTFAGLIALDFQKAIFTKSWLYPCLWGTSWIKSTQLTFSSRTCSIKSHWQLRFIIQDNYMTLFCISCCFLIRISWWVLHKSILVHAHVTYKAGLMLQQVLDTGVIIGNSVFGLFRAKVCPFPRMKRFICTLFTLILTSHIILRPEPQELRLCSMASTLWIHNSYYHQKESRFMETVNGGITCWKP